MYAAAVRSRLAENMLPRYTSCPHPTNRPYMRWDRVLLYRAVFWADWAPVLSMSTVRHVYRSKNHANRPPDSPYTLLYSVAYRGTRMPTSACWYRWVNLLSITSAAFQRPAVLPPALAVSNA